MEKNILRKLGGFFLNGVLIIVPIAAVLYIIYKVLELLSTPVLSLMYNERELAVTGEKISPLAILLLLLFILIMGYIGTKLINEPIKKRISQYVEKIPLYKSITDIINALVGSKKRFNKPVLVKLNQEQDIEVIGFITDEDLNELADDIEGKIGVYLPMSFSFSGHLVIVPRKNVKIVDRNSVAVMKYLVSGGIVDIDSPTDDKD
ncbi:MAG: DUF502 domain-containing protein [Flavobacteriales bacterium]|jgi:uncharacterized membrane protein